MLNEEDHIRIQSFGAGESIDAVFRAANAVDDIIEQAVDYAFDHEFGYLTSCPTNTGTGLRAGFMLHLPALEKTKQLEGIVASALTLGITFRGIHGESSAASGSIYQVSNQRTLGKPEAETIAALKGVTRMIIQEEERQRDLILTNGRTAAEDRAWRSYGILSHCRALPLSEAMTLLSDIRAGFLWGILNVPKPKAAVYTMMMNVQRGGLSAYAGRDVTEADEDMVRAEYVRGMM
jgi:protein arginine kinase